jgi:hypothetical protein
VVGLGSFDGPDALAEDDEAEGVPTKLWRQQESHSDHSFKKWQVRTSAPKIVESGAAESGVLPAISVGESGGKIAPPAATEEIGSVASGVTIEPLEDSRPSPGLAQDAKETGRRVWVVNDAHLA